MQRISDCRSDRPVQPDLMFHFMSCLEAAMGICRAVLWAVIVYRAFEIIGQSVRISTVCHV